MSRHDLRFRLIILLIVAVLPAATLAVVTAASSYRDARAYKASALAQSALALSSDETEALRRVELTLRAAAGLPAVAQAGSDCAGALAGVLSARNSVATGAGVVGPDGTVLCRTGQFEPPAPSVLAALAGGEHGAVRDIRLAAGDDHKVLYGFSVAAGTLVLVTPPFRLDQAVLPRFISGARAAVTTAQPLHPLSVEPDEAAGRWLPAALTLPESPPKVVTLNGRGLDGSSYLYAVALLHGGVYAIVGAPLDRLLAEERQHLVLAIALPLLMLLLSVATTWFAVDRLVLRWILSLRAAAAAYGRGDLRARAPTPIRMPAEIRELALAFNGMADAAEARAEDLETALQAKSRLLRELHHRVKNNFQVIASLLSLQKRAVGAREREILRYPEDRVQALATAYRVSYAAGDIGNVPVSRLAQEILDYIRQSSVVPGALYGDIGCEDVEVDLDTAIPLALLMVETVTPSLEEARRAGRTTRFVMSCEKGDLMLLVNGPPTSASASEEQRLAARLALAFVHQIEGRLEVEEGDPQITRVTIPARRLHKAHGAHDQASPG